jgi:capsular exopolysaccharide synthesis family protein
MNDMEFRHGGTAAVGLDEDPGRSPGDAAEQTPLLAQVLTVARRRKWFIIGAIAGMLLAGLAVTLLMTPKYTASAMVEIRREGNDFTNIEGAEPQLTTVDQEFYQTQYGLMRSRALAERVATELRLFDNADFFDEFGAPDTSGWFEDGRPVSSASTRQQRIRKAGDVLLDNFDVAPERLSRLVTIQFTGPDATLSKRIVDSWAANFIRITLERRFEATSYARTFLEQRLTQLRGRIDQSERQLVGYAAEQNIINLPVGVAQPGTGGAVPQRSLVEDNLATLNQALAQATVERTQAESRLHSSNGDVTEALENPAINGLRQQRAVANAQYAQMMVQFEPNYPPAVALHTQIQELDQAIATEEARVRQTLQQTYQAALTREQDLRGQVDQLQNGVFDLRRRSIQYNIYQRDVDTSRQLYDALLQRYKEIGVAGGVGVNNISIVDQAEVPEKPSSPSLPLNMAIALLAGLAIGVGGAFALEQIDQGLADPSDVERELGVPLLGTVPKIIDGDPLESLEDSKSMASEAYLSLMTTLSFATDHGIPRSIAVTSSGPAEGKSISSYALARSIARSRRRIVLVDADMRSPSMHHAFGIANGQGLSNYLAGDDAVDAMIHATAYPGLSIMTAGPQPPSAPELLSSDRLARLVQHLGERFDQVVFDAPPVMGLADALLLGSAVEGMVFVIEAHRTHRGTASFALGRLRSANAQIIGAVLTKFDTKRAHYGYGYDYGYGYGYDEAAKDPA